jgi:Uma2 family endonuclease
MVAEVSSRGTQATDEREKFTAYTSLPSLREYLIVSQDEMRVKHYVRLNLRDWGHSELRAGDSLTLRCLPFTLTIEELYATVVFDPRPDDAEELFHHA